MASIAIATVCGCAARAEVHPRFADLKPGVVAVVPVRNETIHQLDQVALGGLLDRLLGGPEAHDVPQILRAGFTEALVEKGYEAVQYAAEGMDFTRPLPEGGARLPFDAVLLSSVESWEAASASSSTPAIDMRVRVEVRRLPAAEVLYAGTVSTALREDPRHRSASEVPSFIIRSARKALASLPRGRP